MKVSRKLFLAGSAVAVVAAGAPAAQAADVGLPASGTTVGSLGLTAQTPAEFLTNFSPAKTATTSGEIVATSTNPTWTLTAEDNGTGAGKMVKGAAGCSQSDATLDNPISVTVSGGPLSPDNSAGKKALTADPQTVASASGLNILPLAAALLTTSYEQVIPADQVMETGCVYSLTTTFTLS